MKYYIIMSNNQKTKLHIKLYGKIWLTIFFVVAIFVGMVAMMYYDKNKTSKVYAEGINNQVSIYNSKISEYNDIETQVLATVSVFPMYINMDKTEKLLLDLDNFYSDSAELFQEDEDINIEILTTSMKEDIESRKNGALYYTSIINKYICVSNTYELERSHYNSIIKTYQGISSTIDTKEYLVGELQKAGVLLEDLLKDVGAYQYCLTSLQDEGMITEFENNWLDKKNILTELVNKNDSVISLVQKDDAETAIKKLDEIIELINQSTNTNLSDLWNSFTKLNLQLAENQSKKLQNSFDQVLDTLVEIRKKHNLK